MIRINTIYSQSPRSPMRKAQDGLLKILMLLPLFGAAACASDEPAPPIVEHDVAVTFTISSLSGDKGVAYNDPIIDNQIADFAFYLLTPAGRVVEKIPIRSNELVEIEGSNKASYKVTALISRTSFADFIADNSSRTEVLVKILMLTNWKSANIDYPEVPASSNLYYEDIARQEFQSFNINKGIPMYGLMDAIIDTSRPSTADAPQNLGKTLWLLRTAAKIEVTHNLIGTTVNGNGTVTDVNVSMVNVPASGLAGPYNYNEDTNSWRLDETIDPLNDPKEVHIPQGLHFKSSVLFEKSNLENGKLAHTFYPFEARLQNIPLFDPYNEKNQTRTAIRVDVRIHFLIADEESDETWTYYLQFATYGADGLTSAGKAWPQIVRNTLYKYDLQGLGPSGIKFTVDLVPYIAVELKPWFGV